MHYKKVSQEQLSTMVNFLSVNKVMLHGKTKPLEAEKNLIENLWEELTKLLNSIGNGPSKTASQWKKTFTDWKCNTKKKAREFSNKTGGGTSETKQLSEVEEKLMSVISWVTVKGADVEEVGLENNSNASTETSDYSLKRPGSPSAIPFSLKKNYTGQQTPSTASTIINEPGSSGERGKRRTDEDSNLNNAAVAFESATKYIYDSIDKILKQNSSSDEVKMKELELKEMELKIRFLEAKNKAKELQLLERRIVMEERKFCVKAENIVIDEM